MLGFITRAPQRYAGFVDIYKYIYQYQSYI